MKHFGLVSTDLISQQWISAMSSIDLPLMTLLMSLTDWQPQISETSELSITRRRRPYLWYSLCHNWRRQVSSSWMDPLKTSTSLLSFGIQNIIPACLGWSRAANSFSRSGSQHCHSSCKWISDLPRSWQPRPLPWLPLSRLPGIRPPRHCLGRSLEDPHWSTFKASPLGL